MQFGYKFEVTNANNAIATMTSHSIRGRGEKYESRSENDDGSDSSSSVEETEIPKTAASPANSTKNDGDGHVEN